ncbi:uncharacterized protein K460DRAFT_276323 [Cucurbitaria berberidis CBS 394.84]|uniref:DUF7730 domain-containing protein n=1 Tax=Cucurbitaria berberidis CBS 394.84 TaxID=1168544 RepID=A0A9P4LBW2_9PLEO|nr:uncharacterized protein K460DRAFT_276323 [Cucurbitaria berberidis CBS 394.84]KAF1849455.1 hypothetical protein K460DRAFT_276323 [Cucurbitaria berberidis CBS 394.84]
MTKLPLEIRRMIYEKALGGASIKVTDIKGALFSSRCRLFEQLDGPAHVLLDLALPLLRTCRQIYSEAIEYLYKANYFLFTTDAYKQPTLEYLPYYFLPQRLTQIRSVHFFWKMDSHHYYLMTHGLDPQMDEWLKSWDALSKLTGLQHLHITLSYTYWSEACKVLWEEHGARLLEPIKMITAPRDFVITLPGRSCSTDMDVGESKCIFRLPSGDDGDGNAAPV